MAREIELKLELTPEAAGAFVDSGLFAGDPATAEQRSTYFDTPRRDLAAAGLSLRIRRAAGGRRIQTVKAAGAKAAGMFARPEWEFPVEADIPVLDDATPIRTLLGDKAGRIVAAFEVRVERRSWNVSSDDAEIELVLDRGEVVAGERRTPVCEIELELKGGSPAGLFTLARRIDAVAPVRLGVLAKAERGFRLLGPAARFVKAEPVELTPDMTAAAGFRHVAGACLRHFRLNEMLPGQRDVEALHQMRVALRRLRSAFSIHKEMLRDGRSDGLRDELRWLAGELGAARDLDVLVARSKAGEVRDRLKAARDDAYARADAALGSARARALMLDLAEWLAVGGWLTDPAASELRDRPVKDFAAAALDRLRRKVKKGGRNLATLDDEARHEVRKDAKKLRYAAEFFSSLFDGRRGKRRCRRFVDALEPLQDRLGALNDLATAREVLARIGLAEAPAAASLLPARKGRDALIEAAAEAHDAFVDVKRFWR